MITLMYFIIIAELLKLLAIISCVAVSAAMCSISKGGASRRVWIVVLILGIALFIWQCAKTYPSVEFNYHEVR